MVVTCAFGILMTSAVVPPADAVGSSLLRTIESAPCAGTGAQTWRFGYRLYFTDTAGRITDRAAIPGVESQAQGFADAVATDSACALRASIDIYDMGAEPWTGTVAPSNLLPAADNQAFRASGNYDATFMRYPRQGNEEFSGITGTEFVSATSGERTIYPYSGFPVDGTGRAYPNDEPEDPWRLLLMHEWMHQVVFFYNSSELGWPQNDVHGSAEHGYVFPGVSAGVVEPYFADMLQGKVLENGQPKGLLPQDYLVEGTPAHPKRRFLALQMHIDPTRHIQFRTPADFDGTLTFTAQDGWGSSNSNPIIREGQISGPGAAWMLNDGGLPRHVTVCATSASSGSARYRPYRECFELSISRCVVPRLVGSSVNSARQRLKRARCRLGAVKHRGGTGRIVIQSQSVRPGRHMKPRSPVRVIVGSAQASSGNSRH
jgi:hypothetical protein